MTLILDLSAKLEARLSPQSTALHLAVGLYVSEEATLGQATRNLAVAVDSRFVPAVRGWLDARPFDRKAMGILSAVGRPVEVLAPAAAPPVAGQPRFVATQDPPGSLLPGPPIVIGIVTFYLVRGGSTTPQKTAWEMESCLGHAGIILVS